MSALGCFSASFPTDMRLFESLGAPRKVVFLVWAVEPGTTVRQFCNVHDTEESARSFMDAMATLNDGLDYHIEQEWLIGYTQNSEV